MRITLNATDFEALVKGDVVEVPTGFNDQIHEIALQDIGWTAMFRSVAEAMVKAPASNMTTVAIVLEATAKNLRKLDEPEEDNRICKHCGVSPWDQDSPCPDNPEVMGHEPAEG
jgi:hypothetical protein